MKKTKLKILSLILVMSFVLPLCPVLGITAEEKTDAVIVSEVKEKCSEFGFSRPFAAGEEFILTCDFGPREYTLITENDDGTETETDYIDIHKGIDLYTGGAINLYAPVSGDVIFSGYWGTAGNAVVIDTGLTLSSDSNYTICIVYMHMSEINTSLWSGDDKTVKAGDRLGRSGKTGGNYKHHLHYGIFLKNSDMAATAWNDFPLNPLLFFTPIGYQENL